ncbi:MAG: hypothetical protein NTV95_04265 [Candidatus Saccharibacteria bacterium]|nr:hypothetical protein [Candidatus Saccharibacteria bacterium]
MIILKSDAPLLVVIGPSGSGKSSAVQELSRRGIVEVTPSWTTRPPRKGETSSTIEHKFVSEEEFNKQDSQGLFLEVVQLFNLPYRYGIPRLRQPKSGRIPLIMLRANLLPLLPKHYSNGIIYQIEDELSKVEDRLRKRQADGEQQGSRLQDYKKEVGLGRQSAHRVFTNDTDLGLLADAIETAIFEDFKQS